MTTRHMTPKELAIRWDVKESTLGQWRWFGKGPDFLKLGTLILYRMKEIEKFEDLARSHLGEGSSSIFSHIRLGNNPEEPFKT